MTFIVQARTGSTRLPNKVLLPFYKNKCILELLIEKLRKVDNTRVVIATSIEPNCDAIECLANQMNVDCFRGSEKDVLQRFLDAAQKFGAEKIIRVCSDNPFLDLKSIQTLIAKAMSQEHVEYISFRIGTRPSIKTHYGFWTEYVTQNALKRVNSYTDDSLYREHVTNYIYSNPDKFCIKWIDVSDIIMSHPDIRLTIDTSEDFENAKRIYSELYDEHKDPTIEDIINYLDSHQDNYKLMRKQIEKNNK